MKNKTPRPYLSWSQYNLFKTSPYGYVDAYIYDNKVQTQAMYKGKVLADILEKDEVSDDPKAEEVRNLLPRFKSREFEIETEVAGVPLYGKFDGYDEENFILDEVKTGANEDIWTQKKVDEMKQITFYSMMIYQKYRKLPDKIRVHYAPTEKVLGVLLFTGEVKSFTTTRNLGQIIDMAVDVKNVWEKIQKVCEEEYKSITPII